MADNIANNQQVAGSAPTPVVVRLVTWAWRRWAPVIVAFGAASNASASLTTREHLHIGTVGVSVSWLLVLVGTLAGLIGAGSMAAKSARLEKALAAASADAARGHAAQAALFSEITRELRGLVLRLGLFSSGRASLFHCRGDHFVLVGRFSPSPRYQRSSGRITHPINAGVIGVAWHKGSAERHLPSPGPNEQEPSPRWLEAQDRLGVPAEIARALTMKSSAYAARRINDENGRPLGVLVIESDRDAIGHRQTSSVTQPRVSLELLETAGDAEFAARMVRLLGTIAPLPNADVRRCVEDLLRQW